MARRNLAMAERMLALTREKLRKADTRQKIALGGLVVKAGLDEEESAVILGALLHAADVLSGPNGEAEKRKYREAGSRAFTTGEFI